VLKAAGVTAIVLLLSACGARTNLLGASSRRHADTPALTVGSTATATEVRVIRAWSEALRRGDVTRAAGYFAVPSQMINGTASGQGVLIRIRSHHDAVLANESLPCGARFVSAVQHGRFVDALFVLTARPGPGGSACAGGVGATARTFFLIVGGHIRTWIRAPDSQGPGPAQPTPAPPNPIA
jgi:hypothetical protein